MAWETRRNGRRYYYRSVRVGDRVVKEYCGNSIASEAFATLEECDRRRAETRRRCRRSREAEDRKLDAEIAAFDKWCDLLFKAAMLVAGYHRHSRGQWHMRRSAATQPEGTPVVNEQKRCATSAQVRNFANQSKADAAAGASQEPTSSATPGAARACTAAKAICGLAA
jgi:hypothetical protein